MKSRLKSNKLQVFFGFIIGLLLCLSLIYLILPKTARANGFLPKGSSSDLEGIPFEAFENNIRFMQEVSSALELKAVDTNDVSAYEKTMSGITKEDILSITALNLSGSDLYKVPKILEEFGNLETLDLSYNQILHIPEYLQNSGIILDTSSNLLSSEDETQQKISVSEKKLSEFGKLEYVEELDFTEILNLIRENTMVRGETARGGESVSKLNEKLDLYIDYASIKDADGNSSSEYFAMESGRIFQTGELVLRIYASYDETIVTNAYIELPFTVVAPSTAPVIADIWEDNTPFIDALVSELKVENVDEITEGRIQSVTEMRLSGEEITSLPAGIAEFTALKKLDLTGSRIDNLSAVENLDNLEVLILDENELEELPNNLDKIKSLHTLSLQGNRLTSEDLELDLPLRQLNLAYNNLDDIPSILVSEELESLNLAGNKFIKVPEAVENTSRNIDIDLSKNQIIQLSEKSENMVTVGVMNIDENLLTDFEKQKSLRDLEDDMPKFHGKFSKETLSEELFSKLKLSNGEALLESHELFITSLSEGASLDDFVDEKTGIIKEESMLTLRVSLDGEDSASNMTTFTVMLNPDEELINEHEIAISQISVMQSDALQKLGESTLRAIEEVSAEPEKLGANTFGLMMETKKDASFVINDGSDFNSYTWEFFGDQLEYALPVDLEITAGASDEESRVVKFSNSGYLPGNTVVEIEYKEDFEQGEDYYLYHLTKDGAEYTSPILVEKNRASFTINHTSDYIISKGLIEAATGNPVLESKTMEKDLVIRLAVIVLVTAVLAVFGIIVLKKNTVPPYITAISGRNFQKLVYKENEDGAKKDEDIEMKPAPEKVEIDWAKNEMYTLETYTSSAKTRRDPGSVGIIWDYGDGVSMARNENRNNSKNLLMDLREKFLIDAEKSLQ